MTQTTALVVHEIMDAPDHWSDGEDHITNGYYKVAFDGAWYTMGAGRYSTTEADKESFVKAIATWKEATGWKPKSEKKTKKEAPVTQQRVSMDEYMRRAYDEFVGTSRRALNSFTVHKDAAILSRSIQIGLDTLDTVLRPMGKIEGKKPDAKGSGVSSA